jgi:hypothetical protein
MSEMEFKGTQSNVDEIFSPQTIRKKCREIYERALNGQTHFNLHLDKLEEVSQFVTEVTLKNYPTLNIPFHSRWNHFQVGGIDRLQELKENLETFSLHEQTKSKLDLVVVSVLLDAGAGMRWRYQEEKNQKEYSRSEGLAVASFRMFMSGFFSSDPSFPLRVDAEKLCSISLTDLEKAFQSSESNPLVSLEGRLKLLHNLGKTLQTNTQFFGMRNPRIGNILEFFLEISSGQQEKLSATQILRCIQDALGPIWPGRTQLNNVNIGDVWAYRPLGKGLLSLVPFHKLSQWLSYSLFEPLMENGLAITQIQELTGLAEYRNGGLIFDSGLVELKDKSFQKQGHEVGSELIVEWRALTVSLLDEIAKIVTQKLGKTPKEFPLARVLEGGTWWAGRLLAQKMREDGGSPFKVLSDGTVF